MAKVVRTEYWQDFTDYYNRAAILQGINVSSENGRDTSEPLHVDDSLQHHITIYDTIERKHAGFSNALQQVWFGSDAPKRWHADSRFNDHHSIYGLREWLWLFLLHRVTGSGASFTFDHGFRNSIVSDVGLYCTTVSEMRSFVLEQMRDGRAIFTSIGNQIPPFPKPDGEYVRGGERYIGEFMTRLVDDTIWMLAARRSPWTIADTVDWVCAWHVKNGLKQFKFVLTAWVMDIAEYFPELVDPYSRVHYGANAIEALELLFDNDGFKKKEFLDEAMNTLVSELHSPFEPEDVRRGMGRAMSLEDVACDYVRYVGNYVPKGYEHLTPDQVTHSSRMKDIYPKHWTYNKHIERWN